MIPVTWGVTVVIQRTVLSINVMSQILMDFIIIKYFSDERNSHFLLLF
jgi:hypothetical protein